MHKHKAAQRCALLTTVVLLALSLSSERIGDGLSAYAALGAGCDGSQCSGRLGRVVRTRPRSTARRIRSRRSHQRPYMGMALIESLRC